jgi:hypothetical protein
MDPKLYLKRLFAIWALLFAAAAGYVAYFIQHYPTPLTDHISFDAKLKFVRERVDPDKIDTIIIGSSIGLNNLLGSVMQKESRSMDHILNLSVYGATTLQAEQLMELMDAFPNLERVIYSVQYSDTPHNWRFKDYDAKKLIRYMRREMNPVEYLYTIFKACRNLPFCYRRQRDYAKEHLRPNTFESLLFDETGSVPLYIYGDDIISHRWRLPHPGIMSGESFAAMGRMAKKAKERGIEYYIVHQPYRKGLYQKHKSVRDAMAYFDTQAQKAIAPYGGHLIKIQPLDLNDSYFSDRTHLNAEGSTLVSKYVAKEIDKIESQKERK